MGNTRIIFYLLFVLSKTLKIHIFCLFYTFFLFFFLVCFRGILFTLLGSERLCKSRDYAPIVKVCLFCHSSKTFGDTSAFLQAVEQHLKRGDIAWVRMILSAFLRSNIKISQPYTSRVISSRRAIAEVDTFRYFLCYITSHYLHSKKCSIFVQSTYIFVTLT